MRRLLASTRGRALLAGVAVLAAVLLLWFGLGSGLGENQSDVRQQAGAGSSTPTTPPSTLTGGAGPAWEASDRVDVIIYGSTSSGLGAIRGLKLASARLPGRVRVALISNTPALESPLAQGLSIEDDYYPGTVGGFYREFRTAVLRHYESQGDWPLDPSGRMMYEPQVAQQALESLTLSDDDLPEASRGQVQIIQLSGKLRSASDAEGDHHLILEQATGARVRIDTTYFIDASPEADLARALGCDYMIGSSPLRYNDLTGPRPDPPSKSNQYKTSPQSLALLLTLAESQEGPAPSAQEHKLWRDPQPEPALPATLPKNIGTKFSTSWSMRHVVPGKKHELNETWSDCPDPDLSFSWYQDLDSREDILARLQQRALNQILQLQGFFPEIGVDRLPTWPYVRGEVMVMADHVFTIDELQEDNQDVITCGKYAIFDRHDTIEGSQQPDQAATVKLPLRAALPSGHPYLLVSTAYSVDWRAYNSALRMEPTRANAGAACGALTALAIARTAVYPEVGYRALREELEKQGHVLDR